MIRNASDIREAAKNAIVDIIQNSGVKLKKQGTTWKACCPFHSEKTGSFTVFPNTGTYKCFGCGEGGDAVAFLIDHDGLTFPEALEKAAGITRQSIDYDKSQNVAERRKEERERQQRREALSVQAEKALEHWKGAGLDPITEETRVNSDTGTVELMVSGRWWTINTLKEWGVAYAEKENTLLAKAEKEKWPQSLLKELHLIAENGDRHYDFFRDRIIFPIYNYQNKLTGFGGRVGPGNQNPAKYLNSKDSLLFNKSRELYGIHKARRAIVKENKAILVEGYTDVISLHQESITNAVATCGTSFTAEQAELLKRYAATVILVRDGDAAGQKSLRRDVDVALKGNLIPRVLELPAGKDPDDMARELGGAAFAKMIKDNSQDGIIWRIMQEWDAKDVHQQMIAMQYAADLLIMLPNDLMREHYIKELTKPKNMGSVTKQLKSAIEQKETVAMRQGRNRLSPDQSQDVINYGLYEKNNAYFACTDPEAESHVKITNFVIEPVMLVISRQESRRLVKIKNQHGQEFIADVESQVFSNFRQFSVYVEEMGNFLFLEAAKPAHHIKIKRKLYKNMPACYPIYTMGWHRDGEFWTWSNGLITPEGQFLQVDENGLVDYQGTRYFLKSHSNIALDVKSDDDENTNEDQKNFQYFTEPESIDFTEWSRMVGEVHGRNGMVSVAWWCAAVYRDIIYPRVNCFPHLFLFGPPRSGKSYTAWSLQYMYGSKPKGPTHCVQATDAAFHRAFSWVRNGTTWIDEYGNEASFERVESLKMAYDGTGREKARGGYGHDVTRTPINSGVVISGQQQPTQDIALMTRCILLSYPKREFTRADEQRADDLRELEQSGMLTQITGAMQAHREIIAQHFPNYLDAKKAIYRATLQQMGVKVDGRLLLNYSLITAVVEILASKAGVNFGFALTDLQEYCLECLVNQCDAIDNQDETAIFWNILAYLVSVKRIEHNNDIIVEPKIKERFRDETDRGNTRETRELVWEEERVLVYISMTKIHEEYAERHKRTRNKPGLDIKALLYYLKGSDAYLGEKRGKKFNGRTRKCIVFDRALIPVELLLTAEEMGEMESEEPPY